MCSPPSGVGWIHARSSLDVSASTTSTTIPMKPSLLVIDDHPIVRIALSSHLRTAFQGQVHNIVCADGVDMALSLIEANGGSWLVTLDLCMPGVQGIDAIHALRASQKVQHIIVVSSLEQRVTEPMCIAAGADAFVTKLSDPSEVIHMVERFLGPRGESLRDDVRPPRLTTRQCQVLRCMADGLPNKLIARELGIAEMTVKIHVSHIMRALRATNRTHAVRMARELRLLD